MDEKVSSVAKTLAPSPIRQLSFLAQQCNAINLAEGFPDFPAPSHLKAAAVSAINADFNQYRHVQGICDYVACKLKQTQGLVVDPLTDIVICCGQSEAFAATIFAIIDQGDEVIVFDPSYETYDTCIRLAGGVPVYVALDPPHWRLDPDKFTNSFTARTKAIVLNRYEFIKLKHKLQQQTILLENHSVTMTCILHWISKVLIQIVEDSPQNPTGKVFTKDELEIIAGACRTWDTLAVTDEVYEHITFEQEKHVSLASLSEMQRRTIITSSLSKTFSVTGWRIGWAIAPAGIASAIRNIHIKVTDSAPAPFQEAALTALRSPPEYFDSLRRDYELKRDYILELLAEVGFPVQFKPMGSFFIFAALPENCTLSDVEFVEELIKQAGVVAVPGCGFFHKNSSSSAISYQNRYIRFAFCKSVDTLSVAAQRIAGLVEDAGRLKLF